MIAVCCIGCLPFTWANLWTEPKILLINVTAPEQGYRWDLYNQNLFPAWKNSLNTAIVTAIGSVFAFFMNLFVSYKLIRH
uniref:Uncharacterized protein n=1 Tax=Panagrolaimus sp. JU765 TaxID=591449 RepID=A0AC34R3S6_9BILA